VTPYSTAAPSCRS